jgi:protoheme IX farnesyltransferase
LQSPGAKLVPWIRVAIVASLLVMLFGAFVRASLSGDGCGTSWPFCNGGSLLPDTSVLKSVIEFTHRATSGLLLLCLAGLYVAARRVFPARHDVRSGLLWAVVACVVSAFIGMLLVRFGWVVFDRSLGRAITMPIHLVNNLVLLAGLVWAQHRAAGGAISKWKGQGPLGQAFTMSVISVFLLCMTGALSAMGKTAFAVEKAMTNNLTERIQMHIGEGAHWILRGGALHPLLATSFGIMLVLCVNLMMTRRPEPGVKKWGQYTIGIFLVQMAFGLVNLIVSAPWMMQLGHLLLALLNWMALIMTGVYALRVTASDSAVVSPVETSVAASPRPALAGLISDYIALTKPRVISLLLFTTLLAMFIAQQGVPPIGLILAVMLGGYMAAGAANTFNMVVERDLDVAMERTSHRPTVGQRISNRAALTFAGILTVGSFGLLWAAANLLTAFMALSGLLTYVFVYTLWLKRRTPQNIVIGGAAGAFPPLVGYAAVAGNLTPLAWFLFVLIFTWTPVHFWALALLIKDDYAKAGVPMMPVVKGDQFTVIQIAVYAIVTALICVVPVMLGQAGLLYVAGAALLNLGLVMHSFQLMSDTTPVRARALFKYSMIYLALFFVVMAVDRIQIA